MRSAECGLRNAWQRAGEMRIADFLVTDGLLTDWLDGASGGNRKATSSEFGGLCGSSKFGVGEWPARAYGLAGARWASSLSWYSMIRFSSLVRVRPTNGSLAAIASPRLNFSKRRKISLAVE